ncbi:outer membrane beta-barrel protein [Myxococcaceae bacterium GXIMD 01537]
MTSLSLVTLLALATTPASDAAPSPTPARGGLMVAPKVGFFKSTTPLQGALYLAGEVGYVTPLMDHRLAVVAEVDYHQPSLSGSLQDPQLAESSGDYTLSERELAFLLSAVFRFRDAWGPVTPYLGAGPGLYLHRATSQAFGATVRESEGTLGFQFLGGAELPLGPGGVFAEAHYHFTRIGFLSTGDVNVGGFLAGSVGYRLHL